MPDHGLGGVDGYPGIDSEHVFDGHGLGHVAERCGRPVGVDVVHLIGI